MTQQNYKTIQKCRVCSSDKLTPILSLGDLYVSNFFKTDDPKQGIVAPLELVLCNANDGGCSLLQLKHTVSNEDMYRNYWYRSGINKTMTDELNDIAAKCSSVAHLKAGDYVIDIGANDGTLLRGYKNKDLKTIGYEPAINLQEFNKEGTTKVFVDFFNHGAWAKEFGNIKAKVITAIGMFYDLDDPNTFVADIVKCLDDQGIFIIQMMYLPLALEKNAFDGICHEHLEYYSLSSLEFLLKRHGLEVFDVEMREQINEGSVRVFIKKKGHGQNLNISVGAEKRVNDLRKMEDAMGLNAKPVYDALVKRIENAKDQVVNLIKTEVAKGKRVHGYAASTKGNTTLQYYGLGADLIEVIADRNPYKYGTYTAGTFIPVVSEDESRKMKPDYYFVLAWHFLPEFISRESEFLKNGGKFIVPMPEFRVIGG
jgi:hypothetical protein